MEAPGPATSEAGGSLGDVWRTFKSEGRGAARDQLILHYAPLVKYVAGRLATGLPASVEHADLVSYGMFGLIDALERFDTGPGIKFETYAVPRIKGAILDELRALDWVPRSVRFKAREVDKAVAGLEAQLKRSPTDPEMADRLGVSLPELREMMHQITLASVMALDDALRSGDEERSSLLDRLPGRGTVQPADPMDSEEGRGLLSLAVDSLPEREKLVVNLYYFEGMTLAEIGEVLGVTESRVCQIHARAVGTLRTSLTDDVVED